MENYRKPKQYTPKDYFYAVLENMTYRKTWLDIVEGFSLAPLKAT